MKQFLSTVLVFFSISMFCFAQTTSIVILDDIEQKNFRNLLKSTQQVKTLYDSILVLADEAMSKKPRPLAVLYYEGLLNNDPKRIDTQISLDDMDAVVNLIYASYGDTGDGYKKKAVEFVLAWAGTYFPTGNPINENKFVALLWAYYLFKDHFKAKEQLVVEEWIRAMANAELNRDHTPNNNWQAKRLKLIGLISGILGDIEMEKFSIAGFKEYISTAYFADGTSLDLKQRDALSYHFGGIKPSLSAFINLSKFNQEFDLYDFVGKQGGSIKKSIEYTLPYVAGELQHEEWVNTTVQLDKERAAAGLAKYQPGIIYNPKDARPTFEWACYYNKDWYVILGDKDNYASTWVGLLNSPLVRDSKQE